MCQNCEWIPLSRADGEAKVAAAEALCETTFWAINRGGPVAAYDAACDAFFAAESALEQYCNKVHPVRRHGYENVEMSR